MSERMHAFRSTLDARPICATANTHKHTHRSCNCKTSVISACEACDIAA